jgi:hypothetical protein
MLQRAVYVLTTRFKKLTLKEEPASYRFRSAALDITVTSNDMQNRNLKHFVTFKQTFYSTTIRGLARDVSAKRCPVFGDV